MLVEKPLSLLSGEFNNQTLTKFFKVRTDGSHFLFKEKYRLTTAKAIEVKILQCNMCLSMIVFEYTEKLKCCVADWSVERGFSKRERREIRPNSSSLTPNQLAPNVSKILATGNYSLTPQSEWVKVEDLRLRDQVLRSDGSWGTVTGIYYYNTEPTKVYNLEVEDNHTYIVGGDVLGIGYVVHNYIVDQKDKFLSGAEVEKAYKDHKKMGEKAEIKWGDKTYKKVNGE
ncbi:intein C-terminal splicing domain protein, partial [Leptospira interrogans serovar Icterohaemorrhagiae str. Verdun LP]